MEIWVENWVAQIDSLGDDVVPLGPISIFGRFKGGLQLRKHID
jgi:hypothetical protein